MRESVGTEHMFRYRTVMQVQTRLFVAPEPNLGALDLGIERTVLGPGSWVDVRRSWLLGDDMVFDHLEATTRWNAGRREMYQRVVEVPRLTASLPQDGPGHPVLRQAVRRLTAHYDRPVNRVSLALYRHGRDSVAFHGDRMGKLVADCIVAVLSLRGPRRLLIRPRGGGRSIGFMLGQGDVLVMGGRAQADFEHSVPKVAHAPPRMSVMFRSSAVMPPSQ